MSWGAQIINFRRASSKNCASHVSIFSYLTVKITAPTAMHAEERNECRNGQEALKVQAGRLSIGVRLRVHHTAQTKDLLRVEESTAAFSQTPIFIPSAERPHKLRPMAFQREHFAFFFVTWIHRGPTKHLPCATEGPNPLNDTLTFKNEFLTTNFGITTRGPSCVKLFKFNRFNVCLSFYG